MARRKQKKSPPRRKPEAARPSPAPAAPAAPAAAAVRQDDKRLSKIERTLERGAEGRALQLLDELWPAGDAGAPPERLSWLFARWPDRAAVELAGLGPERLNAFLADTLPRLVLRLPTSGWAKLAQLDSPLIVEATAIRQASDAIASGRDAEGLELLRKVGLRSPFRDARLFLRGLAALYGGQDEEARKSLGHLADTGGYRAAGAALVAMIDPTAEDRPAPDAETSAPPRLLMPSALRQLHQQLARAQVNAALRTASQLAETDPVVKTAVLRMMAETMLMHLELEEVVARLTRAMDRSVDKFDMLHISALCHDALVWSHQSILVWRGLLKEVRAGRGSLGVASRTAQAAILGHIATIQMALALDDDREASTNRFSFQRQRPSSRWLEAVETLRQAVELDPDHFELWDRLIEALKQAGDGAERGRVLERMTARFDDKPVVWREAAIAASDRGSYHLALGHVGRAIELEPMGRDLRDLESLTRLKLARKYAHEGKVPRAAEAYSQAIAVRNRTRDASLKALAEAATFEDLLGHPEAFELLRAQALAADARPWLFAAYAIVAREHLAGRGVGRKKGLPRRAGTLTHVTAGIEVEPGPDELEAIFHLAGSYDQEFDFVPLHYQAFAASTMFYPVLVAAATAGGHRLTTLKSLRLAFGVVHDSEGELRIAEAAMRIAPDDIDMTSARYGVALKLGRPASYFDGALAILDDAITRGVEIARAVAAAPRFFGGGKPPEPAWLTRLREVRANVARYLASQAPSGSASEGKAPKAGARKKTPSKRRP